MEIKVLGTGCPSCKTLFETTQQAIAEFLDRETGKIDTLITKVESAIEKLKEYRTAIISGAVTGKIDVSTNLSKGSREVA